MKKMLFLLSIILITCVGCAEFEDRKYESIPVTVQVVDRWTYEDTTLGICTVIMVGDVPVTICDPDTYETHYNVKVVYDNEEYVFDNQALYNSKETSYSAYFTKEIGEETGKVYRSYLERIGE
jgi:hypothetical protein